MLGALTDYESISARRWKVPHLDGLGGNMFEMKGMSPELINKYDCRTCRDNGTPHEVIDVAGRPTTSASCWGEGIPTTMRHCTGCWHEDGPWVSADIVCGGW